MSMEGATLLWSRTSPRTEALRMSWMEVYRVKDSGVIALRHLQVAHGVRIARGECDTASSGWSQDMQGTGSSPHKVHVCTSYLELYLVTWPSRPLVWTGQAFCPLTIPRTVPELPIRGNVSPPVCRSTIWKTEKKTVKIPFKNVYCRNVSTHLESQRQTGRGQSSVSLSYTVSPPSHKVTNKSAKQAGYGLLTGRLGTASSGGSFTSLRRSLLLAWRLSRSLSALLMLG